MTTNFKSMMPFQLANDAFYKWLTVCGKTANVEAFYEKASNFLARDPAPHEWSDCGLVAGAHGNGEQVIIHNLDGVAHMLTFQFNQRILPAAVRNEALAKRIKKIEDKQGRPVTKSEYAQLRDSVEGELLAKAFIKRTTVPILVYPKAIIVCSSSAKKVEDIMLFLMKLVQLKDSVSKTFFMAPMRTEKSIQAVLRECALDGEMTGDDQEYWFAPLQAVKLRGNDKRTISIKDRDVQAGEVAKLVKDVAYQVVELAMEYSQSGETDEPDLHFTLTESGVYKNIKLAKGLMDVNEVDAKDFHGAAWLFAKTAKQLVDDVVDVLGGLKADQAEPEEAEEDEF